MAGILTVTSAMQFAMNIEASDISYQSNTNIILGDINSDGEVNLKDDKQFKEYFAGKNVPIVYHNADVNEDFIVNRIDAMILARYLADWEGYSLGAESEKLPWENGGKMPEEYTWAEFEALDGAQQIAFQNYFERFEDFEAWMEKAQCAGRKNPWEDGGKAPEDYTWAEFEALDGAQQIAFQNYLGEEGFEAWMEKVQSAASKNPWEDGGKDPKDYTWAEFEALDGAQQIAFQNYLGEKDFEEWFNKNYEG